ncbi:uncharacterized protein TNCV_3104691 [Trichonephila clavipes]|nr:uncharacterized protein TNCV_3104691 [Trichonephila clavipes]
MLHHSPIDIQIKLYYVTVTSQLRAFSCRPNVAFHRRDPALTETSTAPPISNTIASVSDQVTSTTHELPSPNYPHQANGRTFNIDRKGDCSPTGLCVPNVTPAPLHGRSLVAPELHLILLQTLLRGHKGDVVVCKVGYQFRCHPRLRIVLKLRATRGLLATDHVILNHGQVTRTTPELAPRSPNYHTSPHQGEDVSALDRFNAHRCIIRRVFSGTVLELMTCLR